MSAINVRGLTITADLELVTEECCNCGAVFAMADDFKKQRLRDKAWFYCPAGHAQHYTGKSDEQKRRDAEAETARVRAQLDQERAGHEHTAHQLRATKGVVTKTKKRIGNGVCPCCNRHFADVERHMHNQHPEYAAAPA